MLLMWVLTVSGDTQIVAAISAFDRPSASARRTAVSRSVKGDASASRSRSGSRLLAWAARSRRVTVGETSASPEKTVRIPSINCSGVARLSRKPSAPASSASSTTSSRSNVVTTSTRGRRGQETISRTAVTPSTWGIRTSIRTTSGSSSLARLTASRPSAASPTTVMSSSAESRARRPLRTRTSSSASRTRITRLPPSPPEDRSDPEAAVDRAGLQPAALQPRALPHVDQPSTWHRLAELAALVGDVEDDLAVGTGDLDANPARGGVADGVGQRLLDDPVHRPGAAGRQFDAVGPQVHLTAGRPYPSGHLFQVGDRRGERLTAFVPLDGLEHSEQPV